MAISKLHTLIYFPELKFLEGISFVWVYFILLLGFGIPPLFTKLLLLSMVWRKDGGKKQWYHIVFLAVHAYG